MTHSDETPDPKFGKFLVERGWLPEIAGDDDFATACRILARMAKNDRPGKGFLISGTYGCGKTSFVRAAFRGFRFYTLPMDEWALQRNPDFWEDTVTGNVIFDDVGSEHLASHYGIKEERFTDFIVERHFRSMTTTNHGILVITTNLSERQMADRYGGKVTSKLKDLCFCSKFTGKDHRKWEVI